MDYSKQQLGERFQKYHTEFSEFVLALDLSRVTFPEAERAPNLEFKTEVKRALASIKSFAADVHPWKTDGSDNVLSQVKDSFGVTICVVVHKSRTHKNRLQLVSNYLRPLLMESLGKRLGLNEKEVGITVS